MSPDRFTLPSGQSVKTGMLLPKRRTASFVEYPESDLLSFDEIKTVLGNPKRKRSREIFGSDWILNQGNRSSCNAYAVAGALSRVRVRMGLDRVKFGPEFLYALINDNKDQGSMLDDGMRAVTEFGICPRDMIQYQSYRTKDISIESRRVAKSYRAFECYQFPTGSLEQFWHSMVSAVCRNEMIVLAVHVGNRFLNSRQRGGLDRGPGNHAVGADDAFVGDRAEGVMDVELDMFNSWGKSFGELGRTLINAEHVRDPMRYHAMYAIRSATQDPNAENPFVKS